MINLQKMYEFRKKVRRLYIEEPQGTDDLVSKILDIRENNSNDVYSIFICLENYSLSVKISNPECANKIYNDIAQLIRNFIEANINYLGIIESEKEDFYEFLEKMLFIDHFNTTSSIEFSL